MASTLPRPSLPPSPSAPPTTPLPSLPAKKSRKSLPAPATRSLLAPSPKIPTTPSRLRAPSSALSSIPQSSQSAVPQSSQIVKPSASIPTPKPRSVALQPSNKEVEKEKDKDKDKKVKKSISIASFPQPPKPTSKIGRPSLGISTGTESALSLASPRDEQAPNTPQSAGIPRSSKKLRTSIASATLHSSFKNSPSLLNGSADTVPVASTSRRAGSDGLNSAGSPARSRSSSAEGSYSTTATTFEDMDEVGKGADETTGSDSGKGDKKDPKGNVVISVRVRPNSESEAGTEGEWMVDGRTSLVSYRGKEGGDYYYDNVFVARDDNSRVYDSCARRLVRRVMEGFHGTVFAYGMTGTGKTFSMQGTQSSPGVIPRAVQDIFSYIRETPHREFLLRVSYLEIYNEEIRDLLIPITDSSFGAAKAEKIKLREDSKGNVYATPLKEEIVQSTNQLLQVIAKGDKSRRVGATQFNSHSSRSHAIVQIVVESRERAVGEGGDAGGRRKAIAPGGVRVSSLSLIDLAGSERAAEDKARRTEGAHINKSLLTLGTVISRLSGVKDGKDKDGKHLPYRDSKLTRLLQPALSGNSLISILCTVQIGSKAGSSATSQTHTLETINTLKFAARARNNIVSHAKKAEEATGGDGASSALLERYRMEIQNLRGQLEAQAVDKVEKEERQLEQEAHHRHEEQLLEMQLARTALRERIEHLNQLILSSRSVGVNDTRASVFSVATNGTSSRFTSIYNGSDPGSRSVRSSTSVATLQNLQRQASVKSVTTMNTHLAALRSPHMSTLDVSPISPAEVDGSSMTNYASDDTAALEQQVRALQSDMGDKNRYISTLEKRLLQARRTSHGRSSIAQSPVSSALEKDQEISDLKAQLEERDRTIAELRAQNRTLTSSLMLVSPDKATASSPMFPPPMATPTGTEHAKQHNAKGSTGSTGTAGSGGSSFSAVETPTAAPVTPARNDSLKNGGDSSSVFGTPGAISAQTSFSSLKTAATSMPAESQGEDSDIPAVPSLNRKSVDEMSKMLDEMIQDRVERGELTKSRSGSIRPTRALERRQQSMGSVPTVVSLDKKRRQSQIGEARKSIGNATGLQSPTTQETVLVATTPMSPTMKSLNFVPDQTVEAAVGLGLEGVTT